MTWYMHVAAALCVAAMLLGWHTWIFYMGAACLAALLLGWLTAWMFDPDK
jgi:uncharacterized membrane protein YraQ (UPF0718 family)